MIPVVTAEQMRAADAAALADVDDAWTFIRRAGHATAEVARTMMGGAYGRRVVVIAGKGNNGNDGRVAAARLTEWGASVRVLDAEDSHDVFIDSRAADLVIDAAYGIGFRGTWSPPIVFDVPVLAVDIPSGLDATTGAVNGGVLVADRTVTFAALKTGMVLGDGPSVCGEIDIVDVGIPLEPEVDVDTFVVESFDVRRWLPPRDRQSHKWSHSVRVVAGSPGMAGAASLVSASAMRAGAGIVHLSTRGGITGAQLPTEVVHHPLPDTDWAAFLASDARRFDALVIGPGLGRGDDVALEIREVLVAVALPAVVDGDGIAESVDPRWSYGTLAGRTAPTVLTPHDGEFAAIGGDAAAPDRLSATRDLAEKTGCTLLRKGPTTIVATAGHPTYLVVSGDERLATAGSGDVLAGIIGAFLARGMEAPEAAAAGAFVHGMAGSSLAAEGAIARD
ncbi:MAG: NAD(P)H-hydrate dehydratase, partial [Actinobacteria bacterium]|nr:NAD(P)H-hydrate dehydratase [Actinomycetota bacterium]